MTTVDLRIDGLTAAEQQAWLTIRPVLRTYVPKVLRLWKRTTPDQREQIAAHSSQAVAWLFEMFDRADGA